MTFLDIKKREEKNITILDIYGRLDSATANSLENEINVLTEEGVKRLLLNFSGVIYISSGGMRVILATAKKLKGSGDRFGLCCLSSDVHKILKLAGFTSILSIYLSEGEAVAAWQQ